MNRTCGAKKTNGEPCGAPPNRGQERCWRHGGNSPQAKRAGARRVAEAKAVKQLERLGHREPIEEPITELLVALRELVDLKDLLRAQLQEAEGASVAPHVDAYARMLERVQRALTDVARLDLEARLLKVEEDKVKNVAAAVKSLLLDHGIEADDPAVRRALRFYLTGEGDRPRPQPQPALPSGRHHARVRDDACRELLGRGDDEAATLVTVADVREAMARAQGR